jgi:predicted nucleic acid-binding protein
MKGMNVYWDTSAVVSLFVSDIFSPRSQVAASLSDPVIYDFGAAEFASAIALRYRRGELGHDEAQDALARFDIWSAAVAKLLPIGPQDIERAGRYVRRLDLNLRTPDAIHIAIAARLGAEIVTFDKGMAACAAALGVAVAPA